MFLTINDVSTTFHESSSFLIVLPTELLEYNCFELQYLRFHRHRYTVTDIYTLYKEDSYRSYNASETNSKK